MYAPDSGYADEEYTDFLDILRHKMNEATRSADLLIMGDFNAKVGEDQLLNWPGAAGRFGLGQVNHRGQMLLQFCAINDLVICNTLFNHKETRRVTWVSPDGTTKNQIDYIMIERKRRR
ncbi:hypothetical protein Pcinc_026999 [Petrolisthes cinctipes]|uniref:Endonuclease/exonuclease/phosphatase domain-containing protein n=1 Tax=Petrolisthes cinctipes TaxID=88211 RepID=A0AAE1F6Y6_PETCI|nr:hypothetical protein Pcinc_026999 [Petrolisthes cinctipes]